MSYSRTSQKKTPSAGIEPANPEGSGFLCYLKPSNPVQYHYANWA